MQFVTCDPYAVEEALRVLSAAPVHHLLSRSAADQWGY